MRTAFGSLLCGVITLTSFAAYGQSQLELNLDGLDTAYIASLPELKDHTIEVEAGPENATVQPTTNLKFTYLSCGRMEFEPKVQESENVFFLAVELVTDIDCAGLPRNREYSYQIASDIIWKPIVFLNPVPQYSASRNL